LVEAVLVCCSNRVVSTLLHTWSIGFVSKMFRDPRMCCRFIFLTILWGCVSILVLNLSCWVFLRLLFDRIWLCKSHWARCICRIYIYSYMCVIGWPARLVWLSVTMMLEGYYILAPRNLFQKYPFCYFYELLGDSYILVWLDLLENDLSIFL
jgi:hypothetical protein